MSKIDDDIELLRVHLAALSLEENERVLPQLLEVMHESGMRLNMHLQSKMHEIRYAAKIGARVKHEAHGVDMVDANGQNLEHKHTTVKRSGRANICLQLPVRKSETDQEYADRVYREQLHKGHMHISVDLTYSVRESHTVVLAREFVAEYMRRRALRSGRPDVNLGGDVCPTCMRVHRLQYLRDQSDKHARTPLTDDEWAALMSARITAKCKQ